MSHLISPNRMIAGAVSHINAIVDEKPADVMTARQPASGLVLLNSRDRFVDASPTQKAAISQPWNNFILQRAQSIVPVFAKRIAISEVRFPWYIPNITLRNNLISFVIRYNNTNVELVNVPVSYTPGFFTPQQIATNLSATLDGVGQLAGLPAASTPTFVWDPITSTFTVSGPLPWAVRPPPGTTYEVSPGVSAMSSQYFQSPSLAATLGIPIGWFAPNATPTYIPAGLLENTNATTCLYTDFIDIVSDKLMRFTDARDGGSGNTTKSALVCRLYLADETSMPTLDASGNPILPGITPFVIHRQFKTPKQVMWNPQSFIGDLDIQIYDQYGDLVYTPTRGYPDFQITMLASEN
jgi:hypothetical protein